MLRDNFCARYIISEKGGDSKTLIFPYAKVDFGSEEPAWLGPSLLRLMADRRNALLTSFFFRTNIFFREDYIGKTRLRMCSKLYLIRTTMHTRRGETADPSI